MTASAQDYPIHPAAAVLPLLDEDDLKKLANDIKKRGLINPILVYRNQIIDGRNRLLACRLAKIEPRFRHVDSELDQHQTMPLEYVVSLNLRRRHMSSSQCAMAAATAMPQWVVEGKGISKSHLKRGKNSNSAKLRPRGKSDKQLAKLFGVSARYIVAGQKLRREYFDLAEGVFRGDFTLNRALRIGRERSLLARQANERKTQKKSDCRIEIQQGDIRELARKWRGRQVDLILTDPPYSESDLPLWGDLAKLAGKALRPGGYIVALSGLQFLPLVIAALAEKSGLQYFWTLCLNFSGPHGSRHGLGVATGWRPFLVFYKPPFVRPSCQVIDCITTTLPLEKIHQWEQHPKAFEHIIRVFSRPGDWVMDPFAGSGSVSVASRSLGRNSISIDVDAATVASIRQRVGY